MSNGFEQIEAKLAAAKRRKHKDEFANLDRQSLAMMDDKELAAWQSEFYSDEPQWRIAEHEWQRRITAETIRATVSAARWQAYFGIAGVIIGLVLGKILEVIKGGP